MVDKKNGIKLSEKPTQRNFIPQQVTRKPIKPLRRNGSLCGKEYDRKLLSPLHGEVLLVSINEHFHLFRKDAFSVFHEAASALFYTLLPY